MILQLAWRNIWRNKSRSIVIMLSVAIGLLAGIAVLALYKGMLSGRVRTVIDSEVGHLQVHHTEFKKDYHPSFLISDSSVLTKIRSQKEVKIFAVRTVVQGMLATATGTSGVQINGVTPVQEYIVSDLKNKIIEGEGFHDGKTNELIMGGKLADKIKLKKGNKVVLTFTDTADNIISSAFRISSIYRSGNAPLDETNVYVHINTLNELLSTQNTFNEVAILLNNDEQVNLAGDELKKILPTLSVETWNELSPETDFMVRTVDDYSYIIMIIIFIALSFGILNTMLMSVLERKKEIGMMVALGTSKIRIFILVLTETILLSLGGLPFGLLMSYLIVHHYEANGLDMSGMGNEMMASFGFNPLIYPAFPWEKLTAVIILVVATAIISSLFPALKALKLQPADALR